MRNKERIIFGTVITITIFILSIFLGRKLHLNVEFIPSSFVTHSSMLIFSISLIYAFKRYVNYKIKMPQFKRLLKPILFGFLSSIVVNIFMITMTRILGAKVENHIIFNKMSPFQFFLFVFIYASISEELLFRGFLLNILKPFNTKGLKIFKRKVSLPVMFSAVLFGLVHLLLIRTGASGFFLLRIVVFATIIGLIAGYYQEKYDNNAFAIIVHMSANLMGVIATLLMNINIL